MKKTIVLFLFSLLAISSFAQSKGKYSWELGVGASMNPEKGARGYEKIGFHFVGAYQFPESPFAVGVSLAIDSYTAIFKNGMLIDDLTGVSFFSTLKGPGSSLSVVPFVNYHFIQEGRVKPYVGLGAGVSFNNMAGGVFNRGFKTQPAVMPRVGVLFFNCINLSADYHFTGEGFSRLALRLGYTF